MNRSSCVSTENTLRNPAIFLKVTELISIIGLPVFLYGTYCILVVTPAKMKSVKWLMLALHCFSALSDAMFCFVTNPLIYIPAMAAHVLGVFDFPVVELYVMLTLLSVVGVTIVAVFENRYYILYGQGTWWSKVRKPFLAFNYFLAPTIIIPMFLNIPDEEIAFKYISELLPCQPERYLNNRKIFILAVDYTRPLACGGSMTAIVMCEVFLFLGVILWKIGCGRRSKCSRKTVDLQNRFLLALSLQILTHLLLLAIPFVYPLTAIFFNYHNQLVTNYVICAFSLHGFVSSIIMILVHQPYREATLKPISRIVKPLSS